MSSWIWLRTHSIVDFRTLRILNLNLVSWYCSLMFSRRQQLNIGFWYFLLFLIILIRQIKYGGVLYMERVSSKLSIVIIWIGLPIFFWYFSRHFSSVAKSCFAIVISMLAVTGLKNFYVRILRTYYSDYK